jgi:release factor glutamine methyltransferase
MTLHEAQQRLLFQLYHIYDNSEAQQIADMVMEHIMGWNRIDRVMNKKLKMLPGSLEKLDRMTDQLLMHKPVQYVLNESWFAGMRLYVDENVLIPRPETEELADWIVKDFKSRDVENPIVLDIGTGSGCIALAIKKGLPRAEVHACDISDAALAVAKKNAESNELDIIFHQADILSEPDWEKLPQVDCIVSNPPYIPLRDKDVMQKNVLDFEPHLALFVSNEEPLLFYDKILLVGKRKLRVNGKVYFETHENLTNTLKDLFRKHEIKDFTFRKDLQGKDRMASLKLN